MKTIIDRKSTHNIKVLDRMIVELSKYMTELEIDRAVDFLNTISTSQYDINWTETDARTQLEIMFGRDRYQELKLAWSQDNQHLLKQHGEVKYQHRITKQVYDGLDVTDNPNDYQVIHL